MAGCTHASDVLLYQTRLMWIFERITGQVPLVDCIGQYRHLINEEAVRPQ